MKQLLSIKIGFQNIIIFNDHVEIIYNIFGFNFLKREFKINEINEVSTFLKAIIVKTKESVFKFPIEEKNLRKKIISYLKNEISEKEIISSSCSQTQTHY